MCAPRDMKNAVADVLPWQRERIFLKKCLDLKH
jgi:hypothetical protein